MATSLYVFSVLKPGARWVEVLHELPGHTIEPGARFIIALMATCPHAAFSSCFSNKLSINLVVAADVLEDRPVFGGELKHDPDIVFDAETPIFL